MHRRDLLAAGVGLSLVRRPAANLPPQPADYRALFPRLTHDVFLNAAGGTPLGAFAQQGIERFMDFQRLGPDDGRGEQFGRMLQTIRPDIAGLIGAEPSEIALVHSTKAGEHLVLDWLDPGRHRRNVVTNDLHFSGSLHHLEGLRRSGVDVRIVKARNWDVPLEDMAAAIDRGTALVAVTLVSNVTGRVEPMRELADLAHERGALVFADVIQAAGAYPIDVRAMGIDFASCNGYKWLYGVHGAGFLYVRRELQGAALPDRLFPGHVQFNYPPWVAETDPSAPELAYRAPEDARRYEPGHVSYIGYSALLEGIGFVERVGVETLRDHSVRLNRRLVAALDPRRFRLISVHLDRSPIVTFAVNDAPALEARLRAARLIVTLTPTQLRVSPAIYNTEDDIDRLARVLNARA